VASREPLWDQANLADDVAQGRYYLPGAPTGKREALVTSAGSGRPQYLLQMPPIGWAPLVAAVFTAAFFLLLTLKLIVPGFVCGAVAVAAMLRWGWELDPGASRAPVDIGGGFRVPVYASGPLSHSWWAMVVLLLVAGSVFACLLFSYLYLWTVSPQVWPQADALPAPVYALAAAVLLALSSAAAVYANRKIYPGLIAAIVLLIAAFALDVYGHRHLEPTASSYGALVYGFLSLQGFYVAALVTMALYTLARHGAGLLDRARRATFDNAMLLWHYTVAQSLGGLLVVHGFPRWIA
jgi:cytochrome c oxidase subunit I+III